MTTHTELGPITGGGLTTYTNTPVGRIPLLRGEQFNIAGITGRVIAIRVYPHTFAVITDDNTEHPDRYSNQQVLGESAAAYMTMLRGDTAEQRRNGPLCIHCGHPTDSDVTAAVHGVTGPVCPDCEFTP